MENMPQLVLESYIKNELFPITKILKPSSDFRKCCGLGALFYKELKDLNNQESYDFLREKIGESFMYGFANGFDNKNSFKRSESDFEEMVQFDLGKENGIKARNLVMSHFNLPEDF